MDKMVTFMNVRMGNGRKIPWTNSGYTDEFGQSVLWRNIPIYDKNGNPRQYEKNGQMVPVTWEGTGQGGNATLTMNKTMLFRLHEVVHKDVIEKVRNMPHCESSKKSPDAPRARGIWLKEYEPDVIEKKELDAIEKDLLLSDLFNEFTKLVLNSKPESDFILGLAGYDFPADDSPNKQRIFMKQYVVKNPDAFIDMFDEEKQFSKGHVNNGILYAAKAKGIIVMISNDFFYNGQNLGPVLEDIPKKFSAVFGKITEELKPSIKEPENGADTNHNDEPVGE